MQTSRGFMHRFRLRGGFATIPKQLYFTYEENPYYRPRQFTYPGDIPEKFVKPFVAIADFVRDIKYYSASQLRIRRSALSLLKPNGRKEETEDCGFMATPSSL